MSPENFTSRRTFAFQLGAAALIRTETPTLKKIQDIEIYQDELFYSSFPSIVRRPSGELLVAFRRAPDRRRFGMPGITHSDPNSALVLVRSRDNGITWTHTLRSSPGWQPRSLHAPTT